MNNIYNRLVAQLDSLIPFIGLARQEVFNLIQQERSQWYLENAKDLPKTFDVYNRHINNSAFLLGYSYFEAFMTDLVEQIYKKRPRILPKEKSLKFIEIVNVNCYEKVLILMIKKEVQELFYKNVRDIISYFSDKLNLRFTDVGGEKMDEASCIRNCIIHNSSIADEKLAQNDGYKENEEFKLSSAQVHGFGILARNEASNLWQQAIKIHFK